MGNTIVIAGFGPGIATGMAERFGREGFTVALIGRNADRLASGVAALADKSIQARAFPADLSKPDDVRAVIGRVHDALGPITVLHWNAYAGGAGDLLAAKAEELRGALDVATVGLAAAVQAAHADLKAEHGSVLVTNGGFGMLIDAVDQVCVKIDQMGLAIANAAKHKLVRLLAIKLEADGVFVGEVMVTATVKGSAFDAANTGTLEPAKIADAFWRLHSERGDHFAKV